MIPRLLDRHQHIRVQFLRLVLLLPPFGSLYRRHHVAVVLLPRAKRLIGRSFGQWVHSPLHICVLVSHKCLANQQRETLLLRFYMGHGGIERFFETSKLGRRKASSTQTKETRAYHGLAHPRRAIFLEEKGVRQQTGHSSTADLHQSRHVVSGDKGVDNEEKLQLQLPSSKNTRVSHATTTHLNPTLGMASSRNPITHGVPCTVLETFKTSACDQPCLLLSHKRRIF